MLALRCTRRLLDRLPLDSVGTPDEAPNALGHWYANLLQIGGKSHVLALSERSLLCVLLPAAPYSNLLARFPLALEDLLRALSVPAGLISAELRHYGRFCAARTASRSALSCLNQYMYGLKAHIFHHPGYALREREIWLSDYISQVIGYKEPREAAMELLANVGT